MDDIKNILKYLSIKTTHLLTYKSKHTSYLLCIWFLTILEYTWNFLFRTKLGIEKIRTVCYFRSIGTTKLGVIFQIFTLHHLLLFFISLSVHYFLICSNTYLFFNWSWRRLCWKWDMRALNQPFTRFHALINKLINADSTLIGLLLCFPSHLKIFRR